ncbi:MAG: glycosyltransferase family 2 protein [Acidimicrobiales bacterium]
MARASGIEEYEYNFYNQNLGSAEGHNTFFRRMDCDLALVMNPDAHASPLLLVELLAAAEDPLVGIVEARQLPLEHPKEFNRSTGETGWASGACFLVRRDVLRQVEGFDSASFFLYCDDVDFAWRTRLAGYRVVYRPSAAVFHDKRLDQAGQVIPTAAEIYYSAEAALLMAWKYSRPDLTEMWCTNHLASGHDAHRRAVEAFRRRRREDSLPSPLDPEGRVAQFVGYNYGPHRFGYDD